MQSSFHQDSRTISARVSIIQTWSKLAVRLETEHSRSRSVTASLRMIDLPHPELIYQYVNEPKSNAPTTMEMHRGTAILELIGFDLVGDYYTGRGRGEIGTIRLRKQ